MDDLMTGVGNSGGMDDINELARQAEEALQPHNNTIQGQQSAGYNAPQNGYGQQSAGYNAPQSGYGQQSAGYNAPQNGYGQQSAGYNAPQNGYGQQSAGYNAPQSGYGQQSAGYNAPQNGYGQRASGYNDTPQYSPTPDFGASYGDFEGSETEFMTIVKGAIGAIIGAIPGFFFIMGLARFGIIASICGTILAAGTFFGYYIATRKSGFDMKRGGIVCIAVMVIAIFIAVRSSWTFALRDTLKTVKSLTYSYMDDSGEYTDEDMDNIDTSYEFLFGHTEPTYSNCSSNFSRILTILGLKGKFIGSLAENYLFCALGALWLFSKFGKKSF
ncbi:MAG: hypothetical protein IKW96_14575 [Ruminococcus sp.]|uniref:hypothetical protein n=1 Tax=Ruminococcus sp. TaxID=41978 RepID=UPI0025F1EBE3|nr:hypothetical protein [Ruminococcus sp.]MBR5684476.1 hypothetical protein [Ruminococcus sp.]